MNEKRACKVIDGARCKVVGGVHAGKTGTVGDVKTGKTGHVSVTVVQSDGVKFKTLVKNVVVSGGNRP
jgi:ribosomal protein S4E